MREEMSKETPKKDMDNRRIFMTSHKTLSLYQTSLLTFFESFTLIVHLFAGLVYKSLNYLLRFCALDNFRGGEFPAQTNGLCVYPEACGGGARPLTILFQILVHLGKSNCLLGRVITTLLNCSFFLFEARGKNSHFNDLIPSPTQKM